MKTPEEKAKEYAGNPLLAYQCAEKAYRRRAIMDAFLAGSRHIGESLSESLKQAENRQILFQSGRVSGVTTGLSGLDRLTGGWHPSQLIVLAARPAMGKTALMLHFAKAAAKAGTPVCIYSLEMSDLSLANLLFQKFDQPNATLG